jgi:hypothetical protein
LETAVRQKATKGKKEAREATGKNPLRRISSITFQAMKFII